MTKTPGWDKDGDNGERNNRGVDREVFELNRCLASRNGVEHGGSSGQLLQTPQDSIVEAKNTIIHNRASFAENERTR